MSRRPDPFRRPLDATLLALREHGLTYRCGAGESRPWPQPVDPRMLLWHADCPVCGGSFTLALREPWEGAPVTAACALGCHPARIAAALASEPDLDREVAA